MDLKKETLKELGVYELRELARMIGVPSPTTKRREELEDDIIKYSKTSKTNEPVIKNKKGRPPKSIKKVEDLLDVFIPKKFAEVIINNREDQELTDILKMCKSSQYDDITTFYGFVRKTQAGEYYLRNNRDYNEVASISLQLVAKHKLVVGDKVYVQASKAHVEKFYNVNEVYEINDIDSKIERAVLEEDIECILPTTKIKGFNDLDEGGRVLFVGETFKDNIEKVKNICVSLQDEYNIVMLASNISTYHKLLIEHRIKADFIYTLVGNHPSYTYDAVTNCMNYVDVLTAMNKKVIVVIFDLFGIKKGLEENITINKNAVSFHDEQEAGKQILRLLDIAKATKNNASVSVFATCLINDQEEPFFKRDIRANTDTILKI